MNLRIRELVKQSGLDYDELWTKDQLAVDKFAESIIAECLYLCESTAAGQDAEAIQAAIQQHFGVEE